MKRFGFAIRTGGDPEIAGALAAGIEMGTDTSSGAARHLPLKGKAFGEQASEAVRRVAMMRHTPEEWDAMTIQARYDYGQDMPMPAWAGALLGLYGLMCLGASCAWRWLMDGLGF